MSFFCGTLQNTKQEVIGRCVTGGTPESLYSFTNSKSATASTFINESCRFNGYVTLSDFKEFL